MLLSVYLVVGVLPFVFANDNNKCCPSAKIFLANQPWHGEAQERTTTTPHIIDPECLAGRQHLQAWPPGASRGTWQLQSLEVESYFVRYALDFLQGNNYWTVRSGDAIPQQERVVAIRTDDLPPKLQLPIAKDATEYLPICQYQRFADVKELAMALKNSGSWLAIIPSAGVYPAWRAWYDTHLKPTLDELCGDAYCLAGISVGSGDVVADIQQALGSVDVDGNGYLDCLPCKLVEKVADFVNKPLTDTTTFCVGCQSPADDTYHYFVNDVDQSCAVLWLLCFNTPCLLVVLVFLVLL